MSGTKKTRREAIEEFNKFARAMRSVLDLAEHVGTVESLDQAAREAESRLAIATQEGDAIRADVDKMRADAEKLTGATKAKCELAISVARDSAASLIAEAERSAASIKSTARTEADNVLAAAFRDRDTAAREADNMRAALAAEGERLLAAQAELAAVQAQIEQARAIARTLLGGG